MLNMDKLQELLGSLNKEEPRIIPEKICMSQYLLDQTISNCVHHEEGYGNLMHRCFGLKVHVDHTLPDNAYIIRDQNNKIIDIVKLEKCQSS